VTTSSRLLIVTAVPREADAFGAHDGADVIVAGVGRTNAACATTEALIRRGPYDAVICAGVAGTYDVDGAPIGTVIIGAESVYAEEGLVTPDGFRDMRGLGFPLGEFNGNDVPGDPAFRDALAPLGVVARIATVATCSGRDDAAEAIRRRTNAIAEAMEGAAVVHAAKRCSMPAIELRVISNTTGDRSRQVWDLEEAFRVLGRIASEVVARIGVVVASD